MAEAQLVSFTCLNVPDPYIRNDSSNYHNDKRIFAKDKPLEARLFDTGGLAGTPE